MTADEWVRSAQAHAFLGKPLVVTPDGYAELVRLRLAHDPADMADHSTHLLGVPLIVDLGPGGRPSAATEPFDAGCGQR